MSESETLLKQLGLTGYESRAYSILLARSPLTAEKISSLAKIPLPRVYDTMNSLAKRGLVIVSKTRPQTFRAVSPNKMINLLKEDEKLHLKERLKKINDIVPELLKNIQTTEKPFEHEDEQTFAYVKRRTSLEAVWKDMHNLAKKEVCMFAGDLYWVDKNLSLLKKTIKRGIKYRVIWSKDMKRIIPRVKRLKNTGVEIRFSEKVKSLRGVVIDGNVSVLFHHPKTVHNEKTTPDLPDNEEHSEFTTFIMTYKAINVALQDYFNALWKTAIPDDKYLKKHKK